MGSDGFGIQLDLDDVEERDRVYSPDRSRVVTSYVTRHRQDRFSDDTDFEVAVFDVASGEALRRETRSHSIRLDTGERVGLAVASVAFGQTSKDIVITYVDDGVERERIDASTPELNWNVPGVEAPEMFRKLATPQGRPPLNVVFLEEGEGALFEEFGESLEVSTAKRPETALQLVKARNAGVLVVDYTPEKLEVEREEILSFLRDRAAPVVHAILLADDPRRVKAKKKDPFEVQQRPLSVSLLLEKVKTVAAQKILDVSNAPPRAAGGRLL